MAGEYLAQGIKNVIEKDEDLSLGDFGNVVSSLTGIVADSGILVCKTGQNRWDDLCKVFGNFLLQTS